jgi:hypothetical protein
MVYTFCDLPKDVRAFRFPQAGQSGTVFLFFVFFDNRYTVRKSEPLHRTKEVTKEPLHRTKE